MKKEHINLLVIITLLFAVFLLGLFIGRHISHSPISISAEISDGPTVITTAPKETLEESSSIVFPININTATALQLTELPGIGPVLAQRIIDHRNDHGEFTIIEEIMDVSGISVSRFNEIKELITVGG